MANILPYYGDHNSKTLLSAELNPALLLDFPALFVSPIFNNAWIDNTLKQLNEEFYMCIKLHIPNMLIDVKIDKFAGLKLYYKRNMVGDIKRSRLTIY
jgi:hypothetical protein